MKAPWPQRPGPTSKWRPSIAAVTFFTLVGLLALFTALQVHWRRIPWRSARRQPLMMAEQAYRYGNDREAAKLFRNAAKGGNAVAEYKLAQMTETGLGVSRNVPKAIKLYKKAAKKHYVRAELRLGQIYLYGNLVPPNPQSARKYLEKAAYRGNARAATLLGQIYKDGIGVPKNATDADAWFEVANLEGSAAARRARGTSFHDLSIADRQAVITRTHDILISIEKAESVAPPERLKNGTKSALAHETKPSHVSAGAQIASSRSGGP